jgi:hypothetical protein
MLADYGDRFVLFLGIINRNMKPVKLSTIILKVSYLELSQNNRSKYGMILDDDKFIKTERVMNAWPGVPELTYCWAGLAGWEVSLLGSAEETRVLYSLIFDCFFFSSEAVWML